MTQADVLHCWIFPNLRFNACYPIDSINYSFPGVNGQFAGGGTPASETFPVGVTIVTYTAYDSGGNTGTCTFNVIVDDTEDPVFNSCPGTINLSADANCEATTNILLDVMDNCGIDSVTYTIGGTTNTFPGGATSVSVTFPIGTSTVTYTAVDLTGNTATCSFDVVVSDATDPTITCPSDISTNVTSGTCAASVPLSYPTVNDNCAVDSVTYTINGTTTIFPVNTMINENFNAGTTSVTYTVYSAGASTSCNFNVIVIDNEPPTITCPADVAANATGGMTSTVVNNIGATFSDPCGVTSVTFSTTGATTIMDTLDASGQSFNEGVTTVTYIAEDAAGNMSSCSFTVTVTVINNLAISCSPSINMSNDADNCSAFVSIVGMTVDLGAANVVDTSYTITGATSGSGNTALIEQDFNVGTSTVTFTVTDNMGQMATCSFDIVITDDQIPEIECPTVDVFPNDPGTCGASVTLNLSPVQIGDNCAIDSFTYFSALGSGTGVIPDMTYPVGTTMVTYTATDSSGNTNSCTFNVVVDDNEVPVLTCPMDIDSVIASGTAPVTISINTPVMMDNCVSDLNLTYTYNGTFSVASGTTSIDLDFQVGSSVVTFTVSDNNNSTVCSVTVVISEMGDPNDFIDCPSDVFSCNDTINNIPPMFNIDPALVDINYILSGATVGSGTDGVFNVDFQPGTTCVMYIATHVSTNIKDTCTFKVMVDSIAPSVTCPNNITAFATAGTCDAEVSWTASTFSDDCGIEAVISTLTSPSTFDVGGPYNISTVVIDSAGNSASCNFQVTVLDTISPVIIGCPPVDVVVTGIPNSCGGIVTWTAPSGTDNCPGVNVMSTRNSGDTLFVTETITYTFTDASGNTSTCAFEVEIENSDTGPPTIICPPDTIILADPGQCAQIYEWPDLMVTDDCSDVQYSCTYDSGDSFSVGSTIVTCIAIDAQGNDANCNFTITVNDDTPPTIDCPQAILAFASDPDECGKVVDNWPDPVVGDLCDPNPMISSDFNPGDFFDVGTTLVTYTATDNSGNTSSCFFTVTVDDIYVPIIDCPGDIVVSPGIPPDPFIADLIFNANCDSAQIVFNNPIADDNCPSDTIYSQPIGISSGTMVALGEVLDFRFKVVDGAGNADSCDFTVTLTAFDAPVIVSDGGSNFCTGSDFTLTVNNVVDGATYEWETPTVGVVGPIVDVTNAGGNDSGDYIVIATLPNGCALSDTLTVNVSPAADVMAFADNPNCMADLQLNVDVSTFDSLEWIFEGQVISTEENPIINDAESGDYIVTVYNGGCSVSDTLKGIVSIFLPQPSLMADCVDPICLGESCLLIGTPSINPGVNYEWESANGCTGVLTGESSLEVTPDVTGVCIIEFWWSINGCESERASIELIVIDPTETINTNDDLVEISPETTEDTFNVITNDDFTFGEGVTINTLSQPNFGTLEVGPAGSYTYTAGPDLITMDQFVYEVCSGCSPVINCSSSIVTIEVVDTTCRVPTLITPNGDGKNELLIVGCLEREEFPTSEIIIYNQWGDEIYTQSPYGNGVYWDGTYKGEDVPDGTYFFLFRLSSSDEFEKGYITVFR